MENEYICDDRTATPEYIQKLWDMTEEEFENHLIKNKENLNN